MGIPPNHPFQVFLLQSFQKINHPFLATSILGNPPDFRGLRGFPRAVPHLRGAGIAGGGSGVLCGTGDLEPRGGTMNCSPESPVNQSSGASRYWINIWLYTMVNTMGL